MKARIPVSILAATGSVGQRFISLLDNHPWFEVVEITASDKSEGKTYEEACHWLLPELMPEYVKKMTLLPTEASALSKSQIAFSALPSDVAKLVEADIAKKGIYVCSNASAFRKDPLVPILVPEVNSHHLAMLDEQQKQYNWKAGIMTNPNCTTVGFVVPLSALDKKYGITKAVVVSMQAVSGAGYPGVASMDILGNVVPFIGDEEEKLEFEPKKIMAAVENGKFRNHELVISAHTNRVPVVDAHTICLSFAVKEKAPVADLIHTLESYQFPEALQGLPSCPSKGIVYHHAANRPQPRFDSNSYKGMATHVGRLRKGQIFDYRMVTVSHNTIRGAAGGSIFNAEYLARVKFGK